MNSTLTRIGTISLTFFFLVLSACQNASTMPTVVPMQEPGEWQTYTNLQYGFSVQYPAGWQVKEILVSENSKAYEEVWFAADDFPPQGTDVQPGLTIIITEENPSAKWEEVNFNEYSSETVQIGDGIGTKINGINRESLFLETVVMMKVGDVYLQVLPGPQEEMPDILDRILASFDSSAASPEEITIDQHITCLAPYLDPVAIYSENEKLLLRSDTGILVLNLKSMQEETKMWAPMQLSKVALSPDGETLAWSLSDNSIQLIQVSDWTVQHTLIGHPDPVLDLLFSPTEPKLFSASHEGIVRVWDSQTGTSLPTIEVGVEVVGIGISADGKTLAVVPSDGPVQLWDIDTGKQVAILGGTGGYDTSDPVFSPDGHYLAVDLAAGIYIWALPSGQEIWTNVANSMSVAYSPDGSYLAYSDINENNKVFLGPADAQGEFQSIAEMRGPVWELSFSPDSKLLVATDGIEIHIWQTIGGTLLYNFDLTCS
jgi:WD40 repeat protein